MKMTLRLFLYDITIKIAEKIIGYSLDAEAVLYPVRHYYRDRFSQEKLCKQ
jgi:hypothetical protein